MARDLRGEKMMTGSTEAEERRKKGRMEDESRDGSLEKQRERWRRECLSLESDDGSLEKSQKEDGM